MLRILPITDLDKFILLNNEMWSWKILLKSLSDALIVKENFISDWNFLMCHRDFYHISLRIYPNKDRAIYEELCTSIKQV